MRRLADAAPQGRSPVLSVAEGVAEALDVLGRGGLVAIPTETVYGLAADATAGQAVARIFAAKGRPSFNPLICHAGDLAMAERVARFDDLARRLAERFWPGPLTLVLPSLPDSPVHPLARAGLATVGVRVPRGPVRSLIARFARPLAAPSANRSGGVSPTTAAHVARSLGANVDLVLDGGASVCGLESTIVRPAGDHLVLLRPGFVTAAELEEAGVPVVRPEAVSAVEAPGALASHYAPMGRVRLAARHVEPGESLIAFGPDPVPGEERARAVINLSPAGDLAEAAANLFSALTAFDGPHAPLLAVAPVPERGLGEAINDRLRRAAAPR